MSIDHLVAFSGSVDGAAIVAGSPYGCGALADSSNSCYSGLNQKDLNRVVEYVRQRFEQGRIDDPANLYHIPTLLFSSTNDWVVYTKVMQGVRKQLAAFVAPHNLHVSFNTSAGHVWSVDHGACHCGACKLGYSFNKECCDVNNCHYDLSGDMLSRFFGSVNPRVPAKPSLKWVDQHSFIPAHVHNSTWSAHGLARWAFAYVASACEGGNSSSCRIHVNYHGCIANRWDLRRKWANSIDLNEYAEANRMIVLYPQAEGDHRTGKGCWNWGFVRDDTLFDTRRSIQLRTVLNMIANMSVALERATELPNDASWVHMVA